MRMNEMARLPQLINRLSTFVMRGQRVLLGIIAPTSRPVGMSGLIGMQIGKGGARDSLPGCLG